MNKYTIIAVLKKKLQVIDAEINNCKKIIENTSTPLHMKEEDEIKALEIEKTKLLNEIDKFEKGKGSIVDKIKITLENAIDDLGKKIKNSSLKTQIEFDDFKATKEILEKTGKPANEYSIHVDIEEIENKEKEQTAERFIYIKNKKSGKTKKYPASMSKEHLWTVEFENDLKNGFFENNQN